MPLFHYEAITENGRKSSGVIEADSYPLAKERLFKQRILVTQLRALQKDGREISLDSSLLLSFTRELGQLLNAGLPLYESLATIEEKHRHHRAHPLFLDLCDQLKNGSSLSSALKKYPKSFDAIYLSMVESAEQTGSLSEAFEQLFLLTSRQQRLKKKLISALIYPAFLGIFCCVLVIGLLFFVIPSMQELFEGRVLHPMTRAVLACSSWANGHLLFLLGVLGSLLFSILFFLRDKRGRAQLEQLFLKVPFFKTILIQSSLIRFCRAASVLLKGGVPLIDTLVLSRKVMNNAPLEEVIERAERKIVEGEKLSEQLKRSPLIPSLVVRMLSIAEETGRMAPMLQSIAEIYDEEVERDLSQAMTYLQPVLLLMLGAVVGVVLLSLLLPLTDVSSFTSA